MCALTRVAVVGCGGIARTHVESYLDMPEVDLVAIADIRPEALEEFGATYGVPPEKHFADYQELYDDARPDIVAVATRADAHAAPTIAALERGIHVLCEKPIALDLAEADAMIAASEASGAKLAINTQRHTDPVFLYARTLLHDGKIGDLRTIRSECKSYTAAVGMSNIGAHMFDAMALYAGPARWVFAHLTTADGREITAADVGTGDRGTGLGAGDVGTVQIGYRSGAMGLSEYWVGVSSYGFEIVGTNGVLAIRGADPVVLYTGGSDGKATAPVEWERLDVPLTEDEREAYALNRWALHPMMRSLIVAIREEARPPCSGYDGREALEITMAAYVSQRTGRRAELPLPNRQHPLKEWA